MGQTVNFHRRIVMSKQSYIDSQVKQWQHQKNKVEMGVDAKPAPFITISREYGSGGYEIAESIIKILNKGKNENQLWVAYDKALLEKIMDDMGFTSTLTDTLTNNARKQLTNLIQTSFSKFPPQVAVYRKLAETIRILAANGRVIIVGRAGNAITRGQPGGYHARITASSEWKIERISNILNIGRKEAELTIKTKSKERDSFIREFVKFDTKDPNNYDISINNARHTAEEAARLIISGMEIKGLLSPP